MPVDEAIDALIDTVPALRGERVVSELAGGLTNTNYKVETESGSFVVRISSKDAGLPQGQAGAKDENEVADEIEVDEPHQRCRFTTRAARRLRRRVSSRLLSYFGRSSP